MTPEQIVDGANTVRHIASYFVELRARAEQLAASRAASQRGYFTPTEDEAVRQLLVSYWQTRKALLELAVSFREDTSLDSELRPAAFLVAFAAATLLVDAARFLRESFEALPTVRQKLNEPEPYFGIPAGAYDLVQHSLTGTRNAWHLYHALKYFDDHQDSLRQLAEAPLLHPVMEIIDAKIERIRVPVEAYFQTRTRVRLHEMASLLRRDLAGQALYGLQKLMGCLMSELRTRRGHSPQLPSAIRQQFLACLQPGDVLITRKDHAMTNYFLPGYWPHAALYLGEPDQLSSLGLHTHQNMRPRWERLLTCSPQEPRRVLESMKDGVHIRSIETPLACDALAVIRPRLPREAIAEALGRGMFHEGKPYDFDFDFSRSDRLVCTEVVYRAYEGIGSLNFQLQRRAGRLTLSAEDLLAMAVAGNGFDPVAAYAPARFNGIVLEKAARQALEIQPIGG